MNTMTECQRLNKQTTWFGMNAKIIRIVWQTVDETAYASVNYDALSIPRNSFDNRIVVLANLNAIRSSYVWIASQSLSVAHRFIENQDFRVRGNLSRFAIAVENFRLTYSGSPHLPFVTAHEITLRATLNASYEMDQNLCPFNPLSSTSLFFCLWHMIVKVLRCVSICVAMPLN